MSFDLELDRANLATYGLDIDHLAVALEPILPDMSVNVYSYYNSGLMVFTAHYQTDDPDNPRGNPNDEHLPGWVGRFDLDIRRARILDPISPDNRKVMFRQCAIFGMAPYPELFDPIIAKVRDLISPTELHFADSASLLR